MQIPRAEARESWSGLVPMRMSACVALNLASPGAARILIDHGLGFAARFGALTLAGQRLDGKRRYFGSVGTAREESKPPLC